MTHIKSRVESSSSARSRRICRLHHRHTLAFALIAYVFVVLLLTALIISAVTVLLFRMEWIEIHPRQSGWIIGVVFLFIFSAVIGTSLIALFGNRPLRPILNLKKAVHEITRGNYSVRVESSPIPEMDLLISDFNTMAAELGSVEALRNDFIDLFSHEFRTPIVSIRGFAKLLKNDQLTPAERNEYLDTIIDESNRLVQLSTNVLTLSKLENQTAAFERRRFSLDEELRQAIVLLEPISRKKRQSLFIDLEPVQIVGNAELLRQAWLNLIGNSIKFTPDEGQIRISLVRPATIEIADSGMGMTSETQQHIFEKFYQGDTSHASSGHGLGLALVKRIVDLCGGQIEVQSELGEGTRFRIILPVDGEITNAN